MVNCAQIELFFLFFCVSSPGPDRSLQTKMSSKFIGYRKAEEGFDNDFVPDIILFPDAIILAGGKCKE